MPALFCMSRQFHAALAARAVRNKAPRSHRQFDRTAAPRPAGAVSPSSNTSSSATFRSAAFWNRRAGSLRRQRATMRSSSDGMPPYDPAHPFGFVFKDGSQN